MPSFSSPTLAEGSDELLTFSELVQQLLLGPVARGDEEEALWFQHPAQGSHVQLPFPHRVTGVQAYGIKSPLVNANVKA